MKRHIFFIGTLCNGGAERVVSLLSGQFAEDNYRVVIATEWQDEDEYPISDKVRRIHVGLNEKQEQASGLAKQIYRVTNLRKAIKEEKPDVIFSFCVKANYRATMATTGMMVPVIVSVRSDPKVSYVGKKREIVNKLFLNNHGLEEKNGEGNLSTAYDMAILTSYAMKNESYREIVKTKKYVAKTNLKTYVWHNKNKLLSYDYITGGKTGYTDKAKRTLVSTGSRNGMNFVVVTIKDSDDWNTHKTLYENTFENYKA